MPHYRAYPTVADTPNRKTRKGQRKNVFAENKTAASKERKERKLARQTKEN